VRQINNLANDHYTIRLTPGTYGVKAINPDIEEPDEPLSLAQDVTIEGTNAVLDGTNTVNWLAGIALTGGAAQATLRDLKIQNFEQGTLINSDGGCVQLENVAITACDTGLLLVESFQVTVDLTDSEIYANMMGDCTAGSADTAGRSVKGTERNEERRNENGSFKRGSGARSESPDKLPGIRFPDVSQLFSNGIEGFIP